jgi:hypothetical protein
LYLHASDQQAVAFLLTDSENMHDLWFVGGDFIEDPQLTDPQFSWR